MLRIFVASDLHGSPRALRELPQKAALVPGGPAHATVLCGDLTHLGAPVGFLEKLCPTLPQPVLAIPGNVDPPSVLTTIEQAGARVLHDRLIELRGVRLIGFGGTKPTPFHGLFTHPDEEIGRRLDALWPRADDPAPVVLVVHGPPRGVLDRAFKIIRIGSPAVADLVARRRPQLVLSGHVHEARGTLRRERTAFLNPGPGKRGHAGWATIEPDGTTEVGLL